MTEDFSSQSEKIVDQIFDILVCNKMKVGLSFYMNYELVAFLADGDSKDVSDADYSYWFGLHSDQFQVKSGQFQF